MHHYAAKIKEIYIREGGFPGLDIMPYLRIHLPRDFVLFPNLQILYWKSTATPALMHYSSLLLGPSLTDCTLESDVHSVVATMHSLHKLSADIRRLFVSTAAIDIVPMIAPYSKLTSFIHFTTSHMSISDLGMGHLAPMRHLTEWITNASLDKLSPSNTIWRSQDYLFPALQVLSLRGTHMKSIAALLRSIKSPSLCNFTYTYTSETSPKIKHLRRFADALALHTRLDDLFLVSTHPMHTPFSALAPLAALPIRKLRLQNIVASAELSDANLAWLTRSWDRLTDFYCCNDDTPVGRAADGCVGLALPTAALFAHFAVHCPRLVHVSFTIDVTAALPPLPHEGGPALPRSTRPLYFHAHASLLARRDHVLRVLQYATEVYPRLALRLSDDERYSDPDTPGLIEEFDAMIPSIVREKEGGGYPAWRR